MAATYCEHGYLVEGSRHECEQCAAPVREARKWIAKQDPVKLAADARALWAVRVLGAWRENPPSLIAYGKPMKRSRVVRYGECGGRLLLVTIAAMMPGVAGDSTDAEAREWSAWFDGPSDDAARLAAAEAVFPELPEAVRKEIGERP